MRAPHLAESRGAKEGEISYENPMRAALRERAGRAAAAGPAAAAAAGPAAAAAAAGPAAAAAAGPAAAAAAGPGSGVPAVGSWLPALAVFLCLANALLPLVIAFVAIWRRVRIKRHLRRESQLSVSVTEGGATRSLAYSSADLSELCENVEEPSCLSPLGAVGGSVSLIAFKDDPLMMMTTDGAAALTPAEVAAIALKTPLVVLTGVPFLFYAVAFIAFVLKAVESHMKIPALLTFFVCNSIVLVAAAFPQVHVIAIIAIFFFANIAPYASIREDLKRAMH
jgi:hypothetical protein